MSSAVVDESAVLLEGPWTHRFISANGIRFHAVEAGTGPLVLLLHGFPEFWYTWRHQLVGLAEAGYRAVAIDVRGYGASDKPPRGYDGYTLAADVAGLIRALGERTAVLVGHDMGGLLAWTTAAFHPKLVQRLVVLGAAHPLRMRNALVVDPRGQLSASAHLLQFQLPRYEHVITRHNAALVDAYLHRWAGPTWAASEDFADYSEICRKALQIPQAAFCALEAYRWAMRSVLRLSGYRFVKLLQQPITAPTLQLHGELDSCVLPRTAQGSARYVTAPYEWRLLGGVGHFPQLETPELITGEIIRWAKKE